MLADQPQRQSLIAPAAAGMGVEEVERAEAGGPFQPARRTVVIAEIASQFDEAANPLLAYVADDLLRAGCGHAADHRHTRFDDPGLLPGDRFERVAQLLHVVEADRRDDGHLRLADVG